MEQFAIYRQGVRIMKFFSKHPKFLALLVAASVVASIAGHFQFQVMDKIN